VLTIDSFCIKSILGYGQGYPQYQQPGQPEPPPSPTPGYQQPGYPQQPSSMAPTAFQQPSMNFNVFQQSSSAAPTPSPVPATTDGQSRKRCIKMIVYIPFVVVAVVTLMNNRLRTMSPNEHEVENFTDLFGYNEENFDLIPDPNCNEHGILSKFYRGEMAITQTGLECMEWNMQFPHSHGLTPEKETYANKGIGYHNYCRNPDDEPNGAWCYTMDPKVRWEYCACGKRYNI